MSETPWYAAYPEPRSSPEYITREELLHRLEAGQTPGVDFLLIDLRRNDFEGGTITGALNLPAQSLYPSLSTVHTLCRKSGIKMVIWWCRSSRGRGPRAAAWFADYILDHRHHHQQPEKAEEENQAEQKNNGDGIVDEEIKSYVLKDGIRGFALAGEKYERFMVGFEKRIWEE